MHWKKSLHNKCLAIVLCGLITVTHALAGSPSEEQIFSDGRPASGDSGAGGGGGGNAYRHTAQHHPQARPTPPAPAAQHQHHGGSGAHIDSRNSYTMLSQAMSQAVNHEFSKWSPIANFDFFLFAVGVARNSQTNTRSTDRSLKSNCEWTYECQSSAQIRLYWWEVRKWGKQEIGNQIETKLRYRLGRMILQIAIRRRFPRTSVRYLFLGFYC